MTKFLTTNTSFSVFKLNNNGLGPQGGAMIARSLSANADKCAREGKPSSLRTIVCGRNRLENGSAAAWAEAFSKHKGLVEVRMPQNGIRMEGIAKIAEGLSKNPNLQHLDLQDNTATKTGTRSIVKVLSSWPDLRVLNLSDCILGNAGGIALATSLSVGSNNKLEKLQLQYGEFDKRTVEILSEAIAQHLTGLKVLELNGNKFDAEDECVEKLKEALALHGNEDALDDRECCSAGLASTFTNGQSTTWKRSTRRRRRRARKRRLRRAKRRRRWMTVSTREQQARTPCPQRPTRTPTSESCFVEQQSTH